MSLSTNLHGRLKNTSLPLAHCMMPVFEAVVNSIHSLSDVASMNDGFIELHIVREPTQPLPFEKRRRRAQSTENIIDFEIVDNGVGFNVANMGSFATLDSEYKAAIGGRGVGRLLWLKAFERAKVVSRFVDADGQLMRRDFEFDPVNGVNDFEMSPCDGDVKTSIRLVSFKREYRERAPKTADRIANALLEHCLFYFVREGGAPRITVVDGDARIDLQNLFEEYMHASSQTTTVEVDGRIFDLTHIKLQSSSQKQHFIAWCASKRVVEEVPIAGKVPGLHGRIKDQDGEFVYACYVTSAYLDENVRPERIGFNIPSSSDELSSQVGPPLDEIQTEIMKSVKEFLDEYLHEARLAGRSRVDRYVAQKAPRYRPILGYVDEEELFVDPEIKDDALEVILHEKWYKLERSLVTEGHEILKFKTAESLDAYNARVAQYLEKVDNIKRSDLANYVAHRKVTLEILEKAIELSDDGAFEREDVIHQLIVPMRRTSDKMLLDDANLWLIDERLAFHNYLASDKSIKDMAIVNKSEDGRRPDICVLDVMNEPLLVGEESPPATITIIELKRPMRKDVDKNDEDPIEQALTYLSRIRDGRINMANGRPIPNADMIPGFCYIVADLTPEVTRRCKDRDLKRTADGTGFFGFHDTYNAYIEVMSFDSMVTSAKKRNRAFFSRLGLPAD